MSSCHHCIGAPQNLDNYSSFLWPIVKKNGIIASFSYMEVTVKYVVIGVRLGVGSGSVNVLSDLYCIYILLICF